MSLLQATFSDGRTISRNSKTVFPFAWRSVNTQTYKGETLVQANQGFASDKGKAERAARAAHSGLGGNTACEVVAVTVS